MALLKGINGATYGRSLSYHFLNASSLRCSLQIASMFDDNERVNDEKPSHVVAEANNLALRLLYSTTSKH